MVIPMIAALAPSILKGLYGLKGMFDYGGAKRPKYEIPESVNEAEGIYKYLAGADIAGKKEAEAGIFQSQGNILDTLTQNVSSSSALLNAASGIQGQTNKALTDLDIASAQQKAQGTATLANFLQGTKAQYEDKEWQINEYQPFLDEAQAAQKATENLWGGLKEVGGGLLDIEQVNTYKDLNKTNQAIQKAWIDKMFPSNADVTSVVADIVDKSIKQTTNTSNINLASTFLGVPNKIKDVPEILGENFNNLSSYINQNTYGTWSSNKNIVDNYETSYNDYLNEQKDIIPTTEGEIQSNKIDFNIGGLLRPENLVDNITNNTPLNEIGLSEKDRYGEGNIDLFDRPKVDLGNNTIATVYSKSFNIDGKEVLLPTIRKGLNRQMTDKEAIDWYKKTGEYLGKFNTIKEADDYANKLHLQQQNIYTNQVIDSNELIKDEDVLPANNETTKVPEENINKNENYTSNKGYKKDLSQNNENIVNGKKINALSFKDILSLNDEDISSLNDEGIIKKAELLNDSGIKNMINDYLGNDDMPLYTGNNRYELSMFKEYGLLDLYDKLNSAYYDIITNEKDDYINSFINHNKKVYERYVDRYSKKPTEEVKKQLIFYKDKYEKSLESDNVWYDFEVGKKEPPTSMNAIGEKTKYKERPMFTLEEYIQKNSRETLGDILDKFSTLKYNGFSEEKIAKYILKYMPKKTQKQ